MHEQQVTGRTMMEGMKRPPGMARPPASVMKASVAGQRMMSERSVK